MYYYLCTTRMQKNIWHPIRIKLFTLRKEICYLTRNKWTESDFSDIQRQSVSFGGRVTYSSIIINSIPIFWNLKRLKKIQTFLFNGAI